MSLHRAAYLDILEEIRKDLPWLIQVWLQIKGGKDASVETVAVKAVENQSESREIDTQLDLEHAQSGMPR